MSEELPAATERLRKLNDGISPWVVYDGPFESERLRRTENDLLLVMTAYLADHPADAPDWYSTDEIFNWLKLKRYSVEIAKELAELIATNYQLAFNKGFSMGQRTKESRVQP